MTDTQEPQVEEKPVLGIEKSASGIENRHIFCCEAQGQHMLYASCIARLGAIDAPNVRVPDDWKSCERHRQHGVCKASVMRQEELLQGKSIYFVSRSELETAAQTMRKFMLPPIPLAPKLKSVKAAKTTGVALDAMGDLGSYADAINAVADVPAKPVFKVPDTPVPSRPMPVALPGETPLQMARRLAAEKAAS